MAKWRVTNTVPCWVTWVFEIDAPPSKEAAVEQFNSGLVEPGDPEIGDSLDWVDAQIECEEINSKD